VIAWIKKHPQRSAGLLLVIFTQIQGALTLAQLPIPPLAMWGINTAIGGVVAVLAWVVKNTKDEA
jgi:hypothetical protein